MKTVFPLNLMSGVNLFMSIMLSGTACCAGEGDVKASIDKQLEQLESLWTAGKTNEYCDQADRITHEMGVGQRDYVPLSLAATVREAARLLKNFSGKEFAVKGSGIGLLTQTERMARFVAADHTLPPADLKNLTAVERQANGTLLAQYLGRIRSERIPDFKRLRVVPNITPEGVPPGQMVVSGMDPNAISDPVAKSTYLKAIELDHRNALTNERQLLLAQIESSVSGPIVEAMISTIRECLVSPQLVAEWMDLTKLNDQERKQIKDRTVSI